MKSRVNAAVESFMSGFNCAQAVFATYAEDFGVQQLEALKISGGFGSGMGRLQETCGAATGAFMLIGCKHGKTQKEDTTSADMTYRMVLKYADQFIARHGTLSCRELLKCDLRTPEGQKFFKDNNLKEIKCARYVRESAEMVEAMLLTESTVK